MHQRAAGPPRDVPPDRLFRALAARHPSAPLPRPVAGLALTVRPVPAAVEWTAVDAAAGEDAEELRESRLQREVLALVLWHGDAPAFRDADEVGVLDGVALTALVADVGEVLSRIAPTYARSDGDAWARALERGAEHWSNAAQAVAMAQCIDIVPMGGAVPRPDRYWGCPVAELLDGHWMAWRAARAVVDRAREARR